MRLIRILQASLLAATLIFLGNGCGTNTSSDITSVTVTPTNISLNKGEKQALTVTAYNSGGTTVTGKFYYSSSDTSLFTVSPDGVLCAGTWDPTAVTCTPTTKSGTAYLTVSAADSNAGDIETIYVHERVDSVVAEVPTADLSACLSVGSKTITSSGCTPSSSVSCSYYQLVAHAYSNDATTCSSLHSLYPEISATAPCPLPDGTQVDSSGNYTPDTVGEFTWTATDSSIVGINNSTTPSGRATPSAPGATTVWASVGNGSSPTMSPAVPFITCPITKLNIVRADNSTTDTFALDVNGTKNVTISATDSKGVSLTAPPIDWFVSNSYAYDLGVYTTINSLTGQATALKPASRTVLGIDCVSTACNRDLDPAFSNFIVATVNGTANDPTIYAASTNSDTMQPITGTTLGTAITLPRKPNTMHVSPTGYYILMGSNYGGIMSMTTASAAVQSNTQVIDATTLGSASPSGVFGVAVADGYYYLIGLSAAAITHSYPIPNVSTVIFSPEGNMAYIFNGTSSMYLEDISKNTLTQFDMGAVVNDAAFSVNGAYFYLAQPGGISVHSFCGNVPLVDTMAASSPSIIRSFQTADGAVAVDGSSLLVVTTTAPDVDTAGYGCPLTVTDAVTSYDMALNGDTVSELFLSPDNSRAVMVTKAGKLLVAHISSGSVTALETVTLANSATAYPTGGIQTSGIYYWTGGSDGLIHRINISGTTSSDDETIDPKLKTTDGVTVAIPNLVGVREK